MMFKALLVVQLVLLSNNRYLEEKGIQWSNTFGTQFVLKIFSVLINPRAFTSPLVTGLPSDSQEHDYSYIAFPRCV